MILLVGIALALFVVPDGWGLPVVLAFGTLEVAETLVAIRISRRRPPKTGPETLIGMTGRAITACEPDGTVRVRGEDWQARCPAGAAPGDRVRVVAREGLTLLVERAEARRD